MVICTLNYLIQNFNLNPDYKDEKEGALTINEIEDLV